jgi:hypothetical protein
MLSWNPFKKKPIIEFYSHRDDVAALPHPKPAAKYIPEWYKKIPQVIRDGHDDRDAYGAHTFTAKKCMPMLDAMSLGYVIPLVGDLSVKTNHDCSTIEVTSGPNIQLCEFHDIRQVGEKTAPGFPAPPLKFINPWVVKTAPGWSTLFMPLVHNFDAHFTCLSGLVDTDKYPKEVNFPAIWHTPNFDGMLEAGTPLILAIPIKRDAVPSKPTVRATTEKEFETINLLAKMQNTRRKVYTNELREPRK